MKYYGVVYDVGTRVLGTGPSSVEPFRDDVARNDMRVIAEDLHANAVRIEGEDLDRLAVTAKAASEVGLTIFFSPWKMNVDLVTSKVYIAEAAKFAQHLKDEGADVVFIANCEYSIFCDGVYPGTNIFERSAWAKTHFGERLPLTPEGQSAALKAAHEKLNADLRVLVQTVRNSFSGPVTYSSASFEEVDWSIFDFVGPNFYRENQGDDEYLKGLEFYQGFGKPVIVPEFGCCTFVGASDLGARGWRIVEDVREDGTGEWRNGVVPERSETEQADYIEQQLRFFEDHDVAGAFVFLFNHHARPGGEGARDLDMGGYGLINIYPQSDPRSKDVQPWKRKEAFERVAALFAEGTRARG